MNICENCGNKSDHSHGIFINKVIVEICHDCYLGREPQKVDIGSSFSKEDIRAAHWNDIRTRVRTHEGEFLSGRKGIEYQQKWSKKYLGRNLSQVKPIDRNVVEEYNYKQKR